jgi:hypothetical protein
VKTQIIQLEAHDDAISVRDKMGWSQAGRVVLVWPMRGRLLNHRLDLVLILRHSQSLGVRIALVTKDPEVRFQARSLGIPIYKTVRQAQAARWRRPATRKDSSRQLQQDRIDRASSIDQILSDPLHRKRDSQKLSPQIRIGVFALGVLAVLAIAAVLLPSAEIAIVPEIKRQEVNLTVTATDSIENINLTGILPIRTIHRIVEGRASVQTTGEVKIPTGFATGEVTFRNLTDQSITIPAGSVVSDVDSAHRFATERIAYLRAGPGMEVNTAIRALSPGSSENLLPGSIQAIEGDLGVLLTVENTERLAGGSLAPSPAPTPDDRIRLHEQLTSTLEENALQEIQDSLGPNDILIEGSLTLVNSLAEAFEPVDLQPASELELILRLEYQAQYVAAEDREALASAILEANLPEGYNPIPGTMTIEQLSKPKFVDESTLRWRIRLQRDIQADPSVNHAISLVLGRSPQIASQVLVQNLSLSVPPKISTNPSWWPVMPFIPLRINVTSLEPEQASTSLPSITQY